MSDKPKKLRRILPDGPSVQNGRKNINPKQTNDIIRQINKNKKKKGK